MYQKWQYVKNVISRNNDACHCWHTQKLAIGEKFKVLNKIKHLTKLTVKLVKYKIKMCCKMKLDQALKLYIGLYCLCFMFSWFVSIPMIIHVSRDGECLLFVSPYITYGPAAGKQNGHRNIVIHKIFDIMYMAIASDI